MQEFTIPQIRFFWIIGDILFQMFKLLGGAHQVIETFFLPEPPLSTKQSINYTCCKPFPRFALTCHFIFASQANKQVYVVWHDNKIAQLVSSAVKVQ